MSRCSSCQASIVWATTANRKAMPVDADPVPDGNVAITRTPGTDFVAAEVLGPLEIAAHDGPLHKSHFATCPNAGEHRRRR